MPYTFDHALKMARQAVDFAEVDGDFTRIRKWLNEIEDAYDDDMRSTVLPEVFQAEPSHRELGTHTTISGGEVVEIGP